MRISNCFKEDAGLKKFKKKNSGARTLSSTVTGRVGKNLE